ncbi:MAG: hypothetical protein INH41_17965 [Myxococcaceae bacterium]|jgi:hypothetical protein|nr:hypothetical protein [Myxococcaceae bacterium]
MTGLLHAHSGLRYLVLTSAVAALVVFGLGFAQNKPFTKAARIVGSVFAGLTHLQVVLGLVMVAMGTFYPALIGHLVMMLAAAVVLQVLLSRNKRAAEPGYRLPLIGTVVALVLMVGGIFAIGRHPFQMTVGG